MRSPVLVLLLLISGCTAHHPMGWFLTLQTCSECGEKVASTPKGVFEIDYSTRLSRGYLQAYYETPIEAGTNLHMEWRSPVRPQILLENVTPAECSVRRNETSLRERHAFAGGEAETCVLEMIAEHGLQSPPGNGIVINWRVGGSRGATPTSEFGTYDYEVAFKASRIE